MFGDYFFNHNIYYYTPSKHFWKVEKTPLNYHFLGCFNFLIKSFLPFEAR